MHFGHHDDGAAPPDQEVDVEIHLEYDIAFVQDAADAYLDHPTEVFRKALLSALEALDQQTAASDAYEDSVVGSAVFGFSPKGSVIGETSRNPIAEELSASVLRAQVTLVKAAKAAVTAPGAPTLDTLRTASSALAALQPPGQEDDASGGPPATPS